MSSSDDPRAERRGVVIRRSRLTAVPSVSLPLDRLRRLRQSPAHFPAVDLASVPNARRAEFPEQFAPQLATRVETPPPGEGWLHEIKLDGYRLLAHVRRSDVRLRSRNGQDWTLRLSALEKTLGRLNLDRALLDGELVALQSDGTSSFRLLQEALAARRTRGLVFAVFDLLYLDGYDLTGVELGTRKRVLKNLLASRGVIGHRGTVRYVHHFEGKGAELFEEVCRLDLEGIVSKQRTSQYHSGRTTDWLKLKCVQQAELVVGGYTEPLEGRIGFGSLLLGAYADGRNLRYVGTVGSGFTAQHLRRLYQRLRAVETEHSPFTAAGEREPPADAHWVRPELVVDVEFGEWTADGMLSRAVFRGLREDREPAEIDLEGQRLLRAAGAVAEDAGARL